MPIKTDRFRVRPGTSVHLHARPTLVKPVYTSKAHYHALLTRHIETLSDQQERLYAEHRHAILLIFQAMDAAGKDGVIKHVMSGVNPQGCRVSSFKQPSAEELNHDFLWRTTQQLPPRGHIGIFNRSYYEDVLIVRVHPELLQHAGLPEEIAGNTHTLWRHRYRSMLDHERHLHRNGTRIVKFFLHVSKEEQRRRFLQRIDKPDKNWKFNDADIAERRHWPAYMKAYEDCLSATSTQEAPWYVIPADDKKNTRLFVSQIVLDTIQELRLSSPKPDAARRKELQVMRRLLEEE